MPVVKLNTLIPDPQNARRHSEENIELIRKSIAGPAGPARSIVIDEHGVILAGNATAEAARRAGITDVRIIDSDGRDVIAVCVPGLSPAEAVGLAIQDNRAAELATWDVDVLKGLHADDSTREIITDHFFPFEMKEIPMADDGATFKAAHDVERDSGPAGFRWRKHRLAIASGRAQLAESWLLDGLITAADVEEIIARVKAGLRATSID